MPISKPAINIDNEVEYIAPENKNHGLVRVHINASKICSIRRANKSNNNDEQVEYLTGFDSLKKVPIILKLLVVA
jgi:hypothetical protein